MLRRSLLENQEDAANAYAELARMRLMAKIGHRGRCLFIRKKLPAVDEPSRSGSQWLSGKARIKKATKPKKVRGRCSSG